MMAKPSAKKPGRAKALPRHRHHHRHHHRDPDGDDLGMEGDGVAAVIEGAYAVSDAAYGDAAYGDAADEGIGEALREAADAVARAEARLAEIGDELHEAAVYSEKLIREAVETEKRAIDQAATAQEQAIAAAQDAIARALAAAADAAGRIERGGVKPLPSGRHYGD